MALVFLLLLAAADTATTPSQGQSGLAPPGAEGAPPALAQAGAQGAAAVDPAGGADVAPAFVSDEELALRAETDIQAARGVLRRSARSSPSSTTRALALRLLAVNDPGTATARICARSARIDVDAIVRRGAAECLGRLETDIAGPHTPTLVAALEDGNLDVVTMAGWALANVGDAAAISEIAKRIDHPDPRVGALFRGYSDRLRARLGLLSQAQPDVEVHDAKGNRLTPSGYVLVSQAHGLDLAASSGWLGLYGGVMGWYHGAFLLSAHGGQAGAEAAALGGLAGAAIGAAAGSAYAFTRADSLPLAHTIVQLGTAGAFAGFGAGLLSGFPPASGVTAANLSFAGTLAGTAAAIVLVETKPPTLGALGVGISAGLTLGTASGALFAGYGLRSDTAIGAALLVGSTASLVGTIATADLDIGLFPLTASMVGAMTGAGAGSVIAVIVEPVDATEATGWTVASATLAGAGAGAVLGLLLPRDLDPLLSRELDLFPPAITALEGAEGSRVPAVVIAGRF